MNIKVLGSVSPYCKNELNCSGYLVTLHDNKILLDCGNGITRNMNFPHDLNKLCVIISHLHKDHYADIFALYYASIVNIEHNILNEKIKVYIPKYEKDDNGYIDYILIHNLKSEYIEVIDYDENTVIKIDNIVIDFHMAKHSDIKSFYTRVKCNDKVLVYSGDTSNDTMNELISFSHRSDLLICEASLLTKDSNPKANHLYTYETGSIAKEANVDKLLITHFYPEYSKEDYLRETKAIFNKTFVAIENEIIDI